MEFQYELQKSEYEDFYKFRIMRSPEMRKLQHRAWTILPVILLILLVGIRPQPIGPFIAGAVVLSLVWIVIVNWRVSVRIREGAAKEKGKLTDDRLKKITVSLEQSGMRVNGRSKEVRNYAIFGNLVLVALADDTTVILPERIFEGDTEKLRQALRLLGDLSGDDGKTKKIEVNAK